MRRADANIDRLTDHLGHHGVSVAVYDAATGASYDYGAMHGMRCASIAKLDILETLLLRHQHAGNALGDEQRDLATRMIEHSDNDAANDLYKKIDEGHAFRVSATPLGLRHTTPGPGIDWGYSFTSAADFVQLLRNLRSDDGPLGDMSQHLVRMLMGHVEPDQAWGVSAAADPGSHVLLKNGWLAAEPDDDRWIVNSVGLITAHGDPLLIAVLTQHGNSFEGGIDLVEHIAKIAAAAVTSR